MSGAAAEALAVANLKARYCRAADTAAGDPAAARALLAELFTDDVVGDYGFGPLHGPAAIADFLCAAIADGSDWMIHMLHSPQVEVDGDRADGRWTVLTHARRRGTGDVAAVVGRYADVFARTPAGWRIARLVFRRPA